MVLFYHPTWMLWLTYTPIYLPVTYYTLLHLVRKLNASKVCLQSISLGLFLFLLSTFQIRLDHLQTVCIVAPSFEYTLEVRKDKGLRLTFGVSHTSMAQAMKPY